MFSLKTAYNDFIWRTFFASEVTHLCYLPAHCKRPYKLSARTVDSQIVAMHTVYCVIDTLTSSINKWKIRRLHSLLGCWGS